MGVRNIVVIKLAADGTGEWQRTIDSGYDDEGEGVVELTDGRLVIIGRKAADSLSQGSPRWILLSPSGNMIDDRSYASRKGSPQAVVANADGGRTILEENGRLVRFGASGDLRWDRNTTMENGSVTDCSALTLLPDGSYLLGGTARYQRKDALSGARPLLPAPNSSKSEPSPSYPVVPSDPAINRLDAGMTSIPQNSQRIGRETPTTISADGQEVQLIVTPVPTVTTIDTNVHAPTETQNNSSITVDAVVIEGVMAKVDPDGRQSWIRFYPEMTVVQSIGLERGSGNLIVAGKNLTLNEKRVELGSFVLIRLDSEGRSHLVSTMGNATRNGRIRVDAVLEATHLQLLYNERIDEDVPFTQTSAAMTSGQTMDVVKPKYQPGTARRSIIVYDVGPTGTPVRRFSVRGSPPFTAARDGGLVMVAFRETGTSDSYYESPVGIPQPERPLGIRFDNDGQIVWERVLPVRDLKRINAVASTADGGSVVIGETLRMVGRHDISVPVS
ncbi:MAG: hypothetical protein ABFC38_01040 [Methanospirillum sp.]